jgi:hypothetical protein
MLGTGDGSELRQPLGYAIVDGLFVSRALTLFTTSVIYMYLDPYSDRMPEPRAAPEARLSHGRSRLIRVIAADRRAGAGSRAVGAFRDQAGPHQTAARPGVAASARSIA